MTRRYQRGCLRGPVSRKAGPKVWEFYWWETGADGRRKRRHAVLGNIKQLPNRKAAEDEAQTIRLRLNSLESTPAILHFGAVANDYIRLELESARSKLAYPTREVYGVYLRRWILDRWRNEHMDRIRGADVEIWLDSLDDLSNGTKAKIRNIMSGIYSHAKRQGWIQFNPISTVRQSSQREHVPDVLTPGEARSIAERLELREMTLLLLGVATGLRISELLGLMWSDVDWGRMQISVERSIYHQRINDNCKTAGSRKPVPLDEWAIGALRQWAAFSPYNQPEDWVFASLQMKGKQPYWPDRLRKNLQAVVLKTGINKRVGWHTLRHTLSTLLRANGEDIMVQKELMRHASSRTSLDQYSQAIPESKREAQARVMDLIFGKGSANGTFGHIAISQKVN
jgi:integrase